MAVLAYFLTSMFVPINSSAALDSCPDTWVINVPEFRISKYSMTSDNARVFLYSSTLFGSDDPTKQAMGLQYGLKSDSKNISARFDRKFALQALLPDVYAKLNSLGRNAAWSTNYEIIDQKVDTSRPEGMSNLFTLPMRAWNLSYLGIGNGTKLRWKLNISVKDCKDLTVYSNTVAVEDIELSLMSLDNYFENFNNSDLGTFNFKQEELIRKGLEVNKNLISKGSDDELIFLERLGYKELDGREFSYLILGVDPPGCIDSINSNSYPAVNPVAVSVNSLPCKASVAASFKLSEQHQCNSNSCLFDKSYNSLINDFNSTYDFSQYDFVEVDSFELTKSQSAAKQAEAKAAADLKAKQEAEVKAAAELKAKQEAEVKAAAELKAKQKAEANALAEKLAAEKLAAAKASTAKKKTTITCVKGSLTKKVTAIKPVCPKGYKKK